MLNESAARLVVIGTGPVPPPPRMAGLEAPAKEPVKQWTQPAAGPPPTGQYGAPPPSAGGLPLLTQQDFQRFQGMFMQLDTDRDGRVQVCGCWMLVEIRLMVVTSPQQTASIHLITIRHP